MDQLEPDMDEQPEIETTMTELLEAFCAADPPLPPTATHVLSIAGQLIPRTSANDTAQFLRAARDEALAYSGRLERQRDDLVSAFRNEAADLSRQAEEVKSQCNGMLAETEKQIQRFASQVRGTRSTRPTLAAELSRTTSTSTSDAAKVLHFWKDKCSQLSDAIDGVREEHRSVGERTTDLKEMQDTAQFRAVRLLGELRSEETKWAELHNGYRLLLGKLASSGQQSVSAATSQEKGDRMARDNFSAIERDLVLKEEEALRFMTAAVDSRSRAQKHHHHILQRREQALRQRIDELKVHHAQVNTVTLDKTLQLAMDLRSKLLDRSTTDVDTNASLSRLENERTECGLRSEVDSLIADMVHDDGAMQRELRERRVSVIRTIRSSGGNVDARFDVLRAQQHLSAIDRQVASSESERVALKLQLADAAGRVQRNVDFLTRI
jgi:hypothetical protein